MDRKDKAREKENREDEHKDAVPLFPRKD